MIRAGSRACESNMHPMSPEIAQGLKSAQSPATACFRLKDTTEKDRAVVQLGGDGTTTFKTLDCEGNAIRNLALSEPTK
jgi:hypothetical protein